LNFCLQTPAQDWTIGVVNQHRLYNAPFQVVQADLGQPGLLAKLIQEQEPDIVVHCAALANLDVCEQQPELARRMNVDLAAEAAQACARSGARLIHISTDAVFDGKRGDYTEEDQPSPINVYARTKLEAEQQVMDLNPDALVARVNFYGWSLGGERGLGEWFYNNLSAGKPIKGFTDVYYCPLEANDLVDVLVALAAGKSSGIFHVVSPEKLSKYDFGVRLAQQFGIDSSLISPASWKDAGLKANRSPNLTLRTEKLAKTLGRPVADVISGLRRFNRELAEGYPQRLRSLGHKPA
jgi:dTDP-4-dehydrorhamnose reductase